MSIVILGKTRCALCGELLRQGQGIESFPAFVWNDRDPLRRFNDASVHAECLSRDSRKLELEAVITELADRSGPGKRKCAVCSAEVKDPDDYLLLPRLTGVESDPAYRFNYTHLHRSHVPDWHDYRSAMAALRGLERHWKGGALAKLIAELEASHQTREREPDRESLGEPTPRGPENPTESR